MPVGNTMIISITGTPGTGKTEVAKALGKGLSWPVLHLNELAEKKDLYIGFDKKRDCKIVDLDAIQEEIGKQNQENLIIESHFAHEMDADVIIILRCNTAELRKRLEMKGWNKTKIRENVEAELMEVCRQEAWELGKNPVDVDTSGKTAKQIAEHITKVLRKK